MNGLKGMMRPPRESAEIRGADDWPNHGSSDDFSRRSGNLSTKQCAMCPARYLRPSSLQLNWEES
jgi:hypothetical protein